MPRAKHTDALARQWELLKRLPARGPGVTAKDLVAWLAAEGYPASKRTVERDLVHLSRLFPLACNDRGTPYGWHWMPGESADLPGLTVADALSLSLVEDLLKPLLPSPVLEALEPRFRQAHRKLRETANASPNARWADKVRYVPPALPLLPPPVAAEVLRTVQEALLADRQLDVTYQKPTEVEPASLRLHPLGLVQRGPVTYLVATAFDYLDARLYALHRIREALGREETVRRPDGFSIDGYVRAGALLFGASETLRLEARVADWLAALLEETPLSADQVIRGSRGGRRRLQATVVNSWQLRWWVLSQGHGIVVVRPKWFREEVAESLRKAASEYETASDTPQARKARGASDA